MYRGEIHIFEILSCQYPVNYLIGLLRVVSVSTAFWVIKGADRARGLYLRHSSSTPGSGKPC